MSSFSFDQRVIFSVFNDEDSSSSLSYDVNLVYDLDGKVIPDEALHGDAEPSSGEWLGSSSSSSSSESDKSDDDDDDDNGSFVVPDDAPLIYEAPSRLRRRARSSSPSPEPRRIRVCIISEDVPSLKKK